MAFALGLAAAYMWNVLSIASNDVAVELPTVTTDENILVVFPIRPYNYEDQRKKMFAGRDC